jgi:hypothetical protein
MHWDATVMGQLPWFRGEPVGGRTRALREDVIRLRSTPEFFNFHRRNIVFEV